jgi:2-polyprenyl-3-methyl-5-hydroxy-6-metoxy-1,4-benzoquinol methylase
LGQFKLLENIRNMVYSEKHNLSVGYYQHIRFEIFEHIAKGQHLVLDVGCGAGVLGAYLKQQGCASEVVGIEIDTIAAKEALTKLDRVLCADLNQTSVIDVLKDFDKASFDYIICADVLEHLIDPWKGLTELVTYLKLNGRLVTSIPNVRHWSVWLPLILRGQWEYREAGIMDSTHLRFFTRATGIKLIEFANLKIVECRPIIWRRSERLLNRVTFGLCEGWLTNQWVIIGEVAR